MVGPRCIQLCTTSDRPTSTATMGTIQTSETLKRRVFTRGRPGPASRVSALIPDLLVIGRIPDQPGSKLIAASIVNTTTRPKKRIPARGSISPRDWNFTSAATRATTITSSIDQ